MSKKFHMDYQGITFQERLSIFKNEQPPEVTPVPSHKEGDLLVDRCMNSPFLQVVDSAVE